MIQDVESLRNKRMALLHILKRKHLWIRVKEKKFLEWHFELFLFFYSLNFIFIKLISMCYNVIDLLFEIKKKNSDSYEGTANLSTVAIFFYFYFILFSTCLIFNFYYYDIFRFMFLLVMAFRPISHFLHVHPPFFFLFFNFLVFIYLF